MNAQTARGLQQVIQEAKVMNSVPFTKQDRGEAIIRRGLCYLIREISVTGHVFGILEFCREVTRVELLKDPVAGLAAMELADQRTPTDVQGEYWAFAADVFYEAGRVTGAIPDPEAIPAERVA